VAEVESVNDAIHDDLISHDISLRRISGDETRRIERRLDELGSDLKALTVKIDPFGTDRADARERRLARLEKESAEIINEAYREINRIQRGELQQVAAIETEATVEAVAKALP
jgi:hypothetical protein